LENSQEEERLQDLHQQNNCHKNFVSESV